MTSIAHRIFTSFICRKLFLLLAFCMLALTGQAAAAPRGPETLAPAQGTEKSGPALAPLRRSAPAPEGAPNAFVLQGDPALQAKVDTLRAEGRLPKARVGSYESLLADLLPQGAAARPRVVKPAAAAAKRAEAPKPLAVAPAPIQAQKPVPLAVAPKPVTPDAKPVAAAKTQPAASTTITAPAAVTAFSTLTAKAPAPEKTAVAQETPRGAAQRYAAPARANGREGGVLIGESQAVRAKIQELHECGRLPSPKLGNYGDLLSDMAPGQALQPAQVAPGPRAVAEAPSPDAA